MIGIIANELISNSYEHAFPEGKGRINVELHGPKHGHVAERLVADNGAGFAENPESTRLGVGLVRRLAEQLGGTAILETKQGARWEITFPTA